MGIKAGVVGAAGYAGIELVRILLEHPLFDLCVVTSDANSGTRVDSMYPAFIGKTDLCFSATEDAFMQNLDVVFLAVPHTASLSITSKFIDAGTSVVDLSADFRLKDPQVYERWYATEHTNVGLLKEAAFGLPELTAPELEEAANRKADGEAVLVACAGCYPTATSLAAAPVVQNDLMHEDGIVIADAISGVTGAGKKATARTHFCSANESVEAYGVAKHRHTPEIEQILGIDKLVFTPHLAPLNRGLLSTVNIPISPDVLTEKGLDSTGSLLSLYTDFYTQSPFIHIMPEGVQPKTSSVTGTNDAHIGVVYSKDLKMVIATCAIDNLCKGAAGQAVQCANIIFGIDQHTGLRRISLPI